MNPRFSFDRASSSFMTEPADPLPPYDPNEDIHALLEEIRKQNRLLKQCLFILGASLGLYLLMLNPVTELVVRQIFGYAITVAIVLALLLTAPFWMRIILFVTDHIPGLPKSSGAERNRRDS
jgi:hypothetical protein